MFRVLSSVAEWRASPFRTCAARPWGPRISWILPIRSALSFCRTYPSWTLQCEMRFAFIHSSFSFFFLLSPFVIHIIYQSKVRRLITLVDALYTESVQLIVLADASPLELMQLSAANRASSAHDEVRFINASPYSLRFLILSISFCLPICVGICL